MSYLSEAPLDEKQFPPFANMRDLFGFVPNLFRAQTLRPDFVEVEASLVYAVLVKEGALPRRLKEYVFLACSGANLSTYCVTAHCEIVRMLGLEGPEPEQIALDHIRTDLPVREKAMLNFALKLTGQGPRVGRRDVDGLRTYGFTDAQILEAVVVVALAKFANSLAFGLGTLPDFDPSKVRLPGPSDGRPR